MAHRAQPSPDGRGNENVTTNGESPQTSALAPQTRTKRCVNETLTTRRRVAIAFSVLTTFHPFHKVSNETDGTINPLLHCTMTNSAQFA